jgi:hypothetical protein
MKKTIFGLVMASAVLFTGCEKDNLQAHRATNPVSATASEKTIPKIKVEAGSHCGIEVCQYWYGPVMRYNAIYIKNANQVALPSLTYTLYESGPQIGPIGTEVFTPFAQFTCSEATSTYATGAVNNSTKVLVYASDPAYPAPSPTANVTLINGVMVGQLPHTAYETVITGNYEGTPCGGKVE